MWKVRTVIVVALVTWQLVSLVVLRTEPYLMGPLVVRGYERFFGDVQQHFARYEWIAVIAVYFVRTMMATLVSLIVVERLCGRHVRWRRVGSALVLWEVAVMAALILAHRSNLLWRIHEIDWALFGAPESMYSFRNLMWPRLVSWWICTVPVSAAALILFLRPSVDKGRTV
jgi:hypothetical protein